MKSLSRALTLLTELSRHDEPLTLSDLSESVSLHKSTVHRMLATFAAHGLVSRDESNRYVVGPRALDLAEAVYGRVNVTAAVRASLAELGRDVGTTAFYAVPDGMQMRCATTVPGAGTADGRYPQPVGKLHATALGKAYLAYRPHAEVLSYTMNEPFPAETPFTITDARTLQRVLRTVRKRGYAIEDRESHLRARRVGAAILAPKGYAVAAVAIDVPPTADSAVLADIPRAVMDCAAGIEQQLFGSGNPRTGSVATPAGAALGTG